MFDLIFENGIKDQQWPIALRDSCGPASMFETIVFQHADNDLLPFLIDYFLPLFDQSARNCACPLSVSG